MGEVLDGIAASAKEEEVLILLSTDHGGLGTAHGGQRDTDLIIPMFIKGPGIKVNYEFTEEIRNMDMVPTIAHYMGIKQNPMWRGQVMSEAFETNE